MEELELLLNYKEIEKTIKDNKNTLKTDIKENNETYNNKIIVQLKGLLIAKITDNLRILQEDDIKTKLNDNSISEMPKKEYTINGEKKESLFYNCQIINKEIWDIINKIDDTICNPKKATKCYLFCNIVIARFDDKLINIGKIDNNNVFSVENIIYLKTDIPDIMNYIINYGYTEFKKNIIDDNIIEFKSSPNKKINAEIINLLEDKNKYTISEKLKTIILLFINYQIINNNNNMQNDEKVFLINKKWLELYQNEFKEIKKLCKDNQNIKNKMQNMLNNLSSNTNFNDIISLFNNKSSKKVDEQIKQSNIKIIPSINIEKVNLIRKNINIYKDFILLNQYIYNYIKNNFDSSINQQNITYHRRQDFITIQNNQQNTILLGEFNNDNYFEIKYILEFNSNSSFNGEKKKLLKNNIDNYIKNKMIFDKKRNNDYISPILSKNELIGYCYIYKPNTEYPRYKNYYDLLSYDKIVNSINIYYNYQSIEENMKGKRFLNEKYYLINKNFLMEIKVENDFKRIYELMTKYNIQEKDEDCKKNIIGALKDLSDDELNQYKNKMNSKKNYIKEQLLPNVIQANYFDKTEKQIMIYNDFELIRKDIFEKFIDNINKMKEFYLECFLGENKIIIKYPDNLNVNKFLSVVGTLDYSKVFKTQYLLIYENKNDRTNHLNKIKNGLENYLKGLQIYNGSDVIIDKNQNFKEIGVIVEYDKNSEINNNNTFNTKMQPKTTVAKKTNKNFMNNNSNDNYDFFNSTPIKKTIKENFREPPKIGLQNIGATCYMNSTLQCFCHIEKFLDFFKYSVQAKEEAQKNKNTLTFSFKLLIENLWPNNITSSKKYYSPDEFKKKISKMNPLFEGVAANDAKDLVNFIIMTLHEELNKAKYNNINNNNQILDQRNQQLMFKCFANNFMATNRSIISDLFYGINCNITQCGGCNTQTFNFQTYFFLVFPLEEVRKFKMNQNNNNYNNQYNNQYNQYNNQYNQFNNQYNQFNNQYNQFNNQYNQFNNQFNQFNNQFNQFNQFNNQFNQFNNINNNYNNINEVSIFDCFDYDKKVNIMSGENTMYCNYCKRTCNSSMCTVLTTGPPILILLLNRGKGIEFNVKMNFPEVLNLNNYIQYKDTGTSYNLIGVITHIGESSMSGHFIAYCKDPILNKWHKYNDAIVTDVTDFQNEVINFAMPYLLFYQKNK